MSDAALYWLPPASDWRATLAALRAEEDDAKLWEALAAAARMRLDFVQTQQLDRLIQTRFALAAPARLTTQSVRLAVLASSTVDHLLPSIRVAGLRHGLWVQTYTNAYGQYLQELHDPQSGLYQFQPSSVLVALDARHVLGRPISAVAASDATDETERILDHLQAIWSLVAEKIDASVVQQTFLPIFPPLVGGNEQRLGSSAAAILSQVNHGLRKRADASKVNLLSIDAKAAQLGLGAWHDPVLWHRAKQEIHPSAAPLYGDLFARLAAAKQGRSSKCLVLDLDNTLWGGVIGDDGLDGITLGQGSALGEAHLELQHYALALSQRGVILAVCSKNDEDVAMSAFKDHPEMALCPEHIAAFVANWDDKASNLRRIADDLNIGIDSLVFVDDNPFERNIVRRVLPQVWVPELPDDAALYTNCLADAGFFEAVELTREDFERSGQYQKNRKREELRQSSTDLTGYLKSLSMKLHWKHFDQVGLQRTVQLINKTNQFNLTTTRYSESEVVTVMDNPKAFGLQLRLLDHFGDNGIIAIVIGVPEG
ncbi:MAG: HAD-IIIC family phosphatase, partial [Methylocella sp.]